MTAACGPTASGDTDPQEPLASSSAADETTSPTSPSATGMSPDSRTGGGQVEESTGGVSPGTGPSGGSTASGDSSDGATTAGTSGGTGSSDSGPGSSDSGPGSSDSGPGSPVVLDGCAGFGSAGFLDFRADPVTEINVADIELTSTADVASVWVEFHIADAGGGPPLPVQDFDDARLELVHGAQSVVLYDRLCPSPAREIDLVFEDGAMVLGCGDLASGATVQPAEALSAFASASANGMWRLQLTQGPTLGPGPVAVTACIHVTEA